MHIGHYNRSSYLLTNLVTYILAPRLVHVPLTATADATRVVRPTVAGC